MGPKEWRTESCSRELMRLPKRDKEVRKIKKMKYGTVYEHDGNKDRIKYDGEI